MHRTQLLVTPELHRRAAEAARTRRISLGGLVREALTEYLARSGDARPSDDAIEDVLLADPFDDARPDPKLSVDVDHYLYGARRRSQRKS